MPQSISLQALASQTSQAQLSNQAVTLNVYQQAYGLYMDVLLGAAKPIVQGIICLPKTLIVRNSYFGFAGDFCWIDVINPLNPQSPVFTGIGTQFFLVYLTPVDIAAMSLPTGVE